MARRLTTNEANERDPRGRFAGRSKRAQRRREALELGWEVKTQEQLDEVAQRLAENAVYSLKGAMYVVTQQAKAGIIRSPKAAAAGDAPHTRGKPGKNLKGAIRYHLDKERTEAVIGPSAEIVGDVGALHEFGGDRPSTDVVESYPRRPFMGPALERSLPSIPEQFRSSVVGPGT